MPKNDRITNMSKKIIMLFLLLNISVLTDGAADANILDELDVGVL